MDSVITFHQDEEPIPDPEASEALEAFNSTLSSYGITKKYVCPDIIRPVSSLATRMLGLELPKQVPFQRCQDTGVNTYGYKYI